MFFFFRKWGLSWLLPSLAGAPKYRCWIHQCLCHDPHTESFNEFGSLGLLGHHRPRRQTYPYVPQSKGWQQGCARLKFSGWLDSDSCDNPGDSTLTQLNTYFSWLTQLRLNSNSKFANLTRLRLNSFESELSQIWLMTHHILPNLAKSCWPGGGGGCGRM